MATSPLFGWEEPDDVDLVKDGAAAIRTLGNAIDTSMGDLLGGTTGQVLSKASNTNMDFTWVTSDDANAIQNSIVNAKGDLIGASANDTPAILSVGNNGETLVADSSTATGLRYNPTMAAGKNAFINGGFDIWQRGTSFTSYTGHKYTADRFDIGVGTPGQGATTVSRQATGDTTNLPNIQYCARIGRNSGSTDTNTIYAVQIIETVNSIPFAGKTVTLSFYARAGANYSSASNALKVLLETGTGTDQSPWVSWTGSVKPIDTTSTLTTTWQRFTYTATIAATATEFNLAVSYNPVGTAGANDYYEITGIQLEIGSVATAFSRAGATIQGELAACQRYFQYYKGGIGLPYPAFTSGTTLIYGAIQMPIIMRSAPSVLLGGTLYFFNSAAEFGVASPTVDYSNLYVGGGRLRIGGATGLTSGLLTSAYSGDYGFISLSSEL